MNEQKRIAARRQRSIGFAVAGALLLAAAALAPRMAGAQDTVAVSITLKDHKFDPAELHAPPGAPRSAAAARRLTRANMRPRRSGSLL